MRVLMLFFLAIYIPFVTQVPADPKPTATEQAPPEVTAEVTPEVPSTVDPEVVTYALQVQAIRESYLTCFSDLTTLAGSLLSNPGQIRQQAFTDKLLGLTKRIRLNTNILASLHAPPPVKSIHERLVDATDIFDIAAWELEQFAKGHNFDHYANAFDMLGGGLVLWQSALTDLAAKVGQPLPE